MMYVKVEGGVVVQKQPTSGPGFIEAGDEVVCGYLYDGVSFTAPAPPPATVPRIVTSLQGLLAIDEFGLSASYEAWASDPDRTFAEKAFISKAITWRRESAMLISATTSMGLTSEQVDSMFIRAAQL